MLTGLNTAIQYKGEIYHVQTEDGGLNNPVITSILFKGGAIFLSRKTNYKDPAVNEACASERVKALMKEQHKNMLMDLTSGKISLHPSAPDG